MRFALHAQGCRDAMRMNGGNHGPLNFGIDSSSLNVCLSGRSWCRSGNLRIAQRVKFVMIVH